MVNKVKLKESKFGLAAGDIGTVIGRLKPTGPVYAAFDGRRLLLHRAEVEIIERMGWDSVYIKDTDEL